MIGTFVAIEGGDCCGKGIQVKYLADYLHTSGVPAKQFKFPDKNTPIGKIIYAHLFEEWAAYAPKVENLNFPVDGIVNALMFQCMQMANRLEHAQEIMETLHTLKQNVVADRYTASGVVYGGSDGLDTEYIRKIQEFLPEPQLNILLDIDVETAMERMKNRGDAPDRYENEATIHKVVDLYRKFWVEMRQREGDHRWVVVDGKLPSIEVAAEIAVVMKAYQARVA